MRKSERTKEQGEDVRSADLSIIAPLASLSPTTAKANCVFMGAQEKKVRSFWGLCK